MMTRVLIVALIVLAINVEVEADTIVFTSSGDWQTATESIVTEDFNDATLVGNLTVITDNGFINNSIWNDEVDDPALGGAAETTWIYSGAPTAWSTEIDLEPGGGGSGLDIEVTYTDSTTENFATFDSGDFFGFVSDKGISQVNLSTTALLGLTQEQFALDNMSSGFAAVPEPSAIAFLSLAGALLLRRRRRLA